MTRLLHAVLLPAFSLCWAGFIFVLLMIPGDSIPSFAEWEFVLPLDAIVHAILFGIQASLIALAFASRRFPHRIGIPIAAAAFLISTTYGATTELLQHYAVLRSASFSDLLADAVGSATSCAILMQKRFRPFITRMLSP